jgi:hypothetical protein
MGNFDNRSCRLAVIGHLVTDEIIRYDQSITTALGGISYNIAALDAVTENETIYPVCVIGNNIKPLIEDTFGVSGNIDWEFTSITNLPNVVNRLKYDAAGNRDEWNSRVPDPIDISGLHNNFVAVLMNFISGDDVELESLLKFRERFSGLIYIDFHSLALGRDPDGKRFLRENPLWRDYVSIADCLQLNHNELATITDLKTDDVKQVAKIVRGLHELGPRVIAVTMAERGSIVSDYGMDQVFYLPAVETSEINDPTGCGDTFASVFFYNLVRSKDIKEALVEANLYAAAKATFSGLTGFREIALIKRGLMENHKPLRIQSL